MTTLADKVRLLLNSGLFDERWYVERYPDVAHCGMSPAEHFVRVGQHIGRKASRDADGRASEFLVAYREPPAIDAQVDPGLCQRIASSGLFDDAWYVKHHASDTLAGQSAPVPELIADYLRRSAQDPSIDPGPLFSTLQYAKFHPDSRKTAPLAHAVDHGFAEGRAIFDANRVDAFLAENCEISLTSIDALLDLSLPVHVVHWADGNFFFSEIAAYLKAALGRAGYSVTCDTDLAKPESFKGNIVIVAPHEFCVHGPGKKWREPLLRQAIYLNTEQWHTSWFSLAYKFLKLSNKAIDMNPASAAGLQALGIETAFLPLLPMAGSPFEVSRAPLSDGFAKARYIEKLTYPEMLAQRPYDVLFVGASNPRREKALATLAPVLADHEAFIHCPRFDGPVRQGDPDMLATGDLVQIARNAKILLNIHQGESRYFEWHRLFLFGIVEGCVVLTEPCIPNRYVEAGEHFLECRLQDMPERLRWLLETPEGQAEMGRIRNNCDQLRARTSDWSRLAA